ncbi:hypothetical protein HPB50_000741 [Hyalomma asiaticum]|uniref:Uncharacterized protein n=1 Tax=Hyalomma asiaticum TaxID=266040 RepID=A0ACB7SNR1_HYAAI|nr:hypothetical protein HPB50_000741 [Hyalomma asiaticum]
MNKLPLVKVVGGDNIDPATLPFVESPESSFSLGVDSSIELPPSLDECDVEMLCHRDVRRATHLALAWTAPGAAVPSRRSPRSLKPFREAEWLCSVFTVRTLECSQSAGLYHTTSLSKPLRKVLLESVFTLALVQEQRCFCTLRKARETGGRRLVTTSASCKLAATAADAVTPAAKSHRCPLQCIERSHESFWEDGASGENKNDGKLYGGGDLNGSKVNIRQRPVIRWNALLLTDPRASRSVKQSSREKTKDCGCRFCLPDVAAFLETGQALEHPDDRLSGFISVVQRGERNCLAEATVAAAVIGSKKLFSSSPPSALLILAAADWLELDDVLGR